MIGFLAIMIGGIAAICGLGALLAWMVTPSAGSMTVNVLPDPEAFNLPLPHGGWISFK